MTARSHHLVRLALAAGCASAVVGCGDEAEPGTPALDESVDQTAIDAFIDPGVPFRERPAGPAPLEAACPREDVQPCPGILGRWTGFPPRDADWDVHVAFSDGVLWSAARASQPRAVVVVEDVGGAERVHRLPLDAMIVDLQIVGREVGGPGVAVLTGSALDAPERVIGWLPLEDADGPPSVNRPVVEADGEAPWSLAPSWGPDGDLWLALRSRSGSGRIVHPAGLPTVPTHCGVRPGPLAARCDAPLLFATPASPTRGDCTPDLYALRDGGWIATEAPLPTSAVAPADFAVSAAGTVAVVEVAWEGIWAAWRPLDGRWRRLPTLLQGPDGREGPLARFVGDALHVAYTARRSDGDVIAYWIFEDERWRPAPGSGPEGVIYEGWDLLSFDVDGCGRAAVAVQRAEPGTRRREVEIRRLD